MQDHIYHLPVPALPDAAREVLRFDGQPVTTTEGNTITTPVQRTGGRNLMFRAKVLPEAAGGARVRFEVGHWNDGETPAFSENGMYLTLFDRYGGEDAQRLRQAESAACQARNALTQFSHGCGY